MTMLDVSLNSVGSLPTTLGKLKNLENLQIYKIIARQVFPDVLTTMTWLKTLSMYFSSYSGLIPVGITNMVSLQNLYIGSNSFSNLPSAMGLMTNLRELVVDGNRFSLTSTTVTTIPESFSNLRLLSRFQAFGGCPSNVPNGQVSQCFLTGTIPSGMSAMTALTELLLHNNKMLGTIPPSLGALTNMVSLTLHSNFFNGTIPSAISGASKMVTLTLNNNLLVGSIPSAIGTMTKLYTLNMCCNKLSESIPYGLGTLTKLNSLSLNGNSLVGTIPSDFRLMFSLKTLDLSTNYLTMGGQSSVPQATFSANTTGSGLLKLFSNCLALTYTSPRSFSCVVDQARCPPTGEKKAFSAPCIFTD
jgi:LRR receptor-like serine/threonine-protein kinase FLS2